MRRIPRFPAAYRRRTGSACCGAIGIINIARRASLSWRRFATATVAMATAVFSIVVATVGSRSAGMSFCWADECEGERHKHRHLQKKEQGKLQFNAAVAFATIMKPFTHAYPPNQHHGSRLPDQVRARPSETNMSPTERPSWTITLNFLPYRSSSRPSGGSNKKVRLWSKSRRRSRARMPSLYS